MNQSSQTKPSTPRIAFVQARWHADIVDACRVSFLQTIDAAADQFFVDPYDVPGAFEIPLQAKLLAESGRYAAIIGAAFVVDGGIYRHEFVANSVLSGLMQAQMETDIPILSAVLTPHQFQDTDEHRVFFTDHFRVKGREAAEACIGILETRRQILQAA